MRVLDAESQPRPDSMLFPPHVVPVTCALTSSVLGDGKGTQVRVPVLPTK